MDHYFQALAGGLMIGAAALLLYAGSGRIAGISGILFGALRETGGERRWRLGFLLALLAGGGLAAALGAAPPAPAQQASALALSLLGGLLVGIGTRMGNGCTSGHGVCGLARRSWRSLAASACFMAVGMFSATLLRPLLLRS